MGEGEASITSMKADLSLGPKVCFRILSGYRVEALTLGCSGDFCATVARISALPTLPLDVTVRVCGNELRIRLSGEPIPRSKPLLILHGICSMEVMKGSLDLPCERGELPSYLALSDLEEELQEFGLNVRGRVLHKGRISAYLLSLPTGGVLEAGKRTSNLPPGRYLLVIPGAGKLVAEGEELFLP